MHCNDFSPNRTRFDKQFLFERTYQALSVLVGSSRQLHPMVKVGNIFGDAYLSLIVWTCGNYIGAHKSFDIICEMRDDG
jgi:hypothetical protein